MIKTEQALVEIIKNAQSGIYDKNAWLIRHFSGEITKVIELKNPLLGELLVLDIGRFLQIINPTLEEEIQWFQDAKKGIQFWVNDIVIANRLLGIKNDNVYDTTIFEKAVMQKFYLSKKPKHNAIIETNFQTMVELVELGARRF